MGTSLGMNTDKARDVSSSVAGYAEALSFVETQLDMARLASLNPINFFSPGALILSPVSITVAASAAADLANARATLAYLATRLAQEATQQDQVSNSLLVTDPGWFAQAPNAKKPTVITLGDQLWDDFGSLINISSYILMIEGAFETVSDIFEKWWKEASWAQDVIKWGTSLGKWVPYVGMPIAWIGVATDWDEDYVWGNTRNVIGAVIATAEVVTLIPPLTPASPVIGAVGLVWDIFDTVWDLGDEFWW